MDNNINAYTGKMNIFSLFLLFGFRRAMYCRPLWTSWHDADWVSFTESTANNPEAAAGPGGENSNGTLTFAHRQIKLLNVVLFQFMRSENKFQCQLYCGD